MLLPALLNCIDLYASFFTSCLFNVGVLDAASSKLMYWSDQGIAEETN